MNGLKYIRTQSNLSLNELAEVLGISRQALSAWETDQKPIPEKRKEQLGEFFGIDSGYIGDITEEAVQKLREKVMFSHIIKDKEIRLYRPKEGTKTLHRLYMTFADDSGLTLDEQYARAKKRKQATLDKADEIIRYHDRCEHLLDKISVINKRSRVYDALNVLMGEIPNKSIIKRMPYFHEIEADLYAMLLGYGLITEEEVLENYAHCADGLYDESGWILSLAKEMKAHWEEKDRKFDEIDKEIRAERKAQRKQEAADPKPLRTLEAQIAEYEAFCKKMREEFEG